MLVSLQRHSLGNTMHLEQLLSWMFWPISCVGTYLNEGFGSLLILLVTLIPAALLWRVQLPLRKKLAVAGVLYLSIFMIGTSIVKLTTTDLSNGEIDTSWNVFWLQAEASVAVIMVSLSAFRSLFVAVGTKRIQEAKSGSQKYSNGYTWEQEMARFKAPWCAIFILLQHRSFGLGCHGRGCGVTANWGH